MRHQKRGRAFGLKRDGRRAFARSLVLNLIMRGKITTTEARAKEIRPMVEKLVTRARADTVGNRRIIASRLGNDTGAVRVLFGTLGPKYKTRPGGYTRITKLPPRAADAARVAVIEFV